MPESTASLPMPSTAPARADDVLIVGGGPAGLSLAISLAQAGFAATVVERQSGADLAAPAPDGREIALTHPSAATLQRLGSWQHLLPNEIGRIHEAQVHDGPVGRASPLRLRTARGPGHLGWIVPNHALRRSAHAVAAATPGVRLLTGLQVARAAIGPGAAELECLPAAGTGPEGARPLRLRAPLVVAADSRFSAMRRQLGIGAASTDFGRTVIVCRMRHEAAGDGTAHECFGYERTLAILPLPPDAGTGAPLCSVVVTARSDDAAALLALPPADFAAQVQAQFGHRLGAMHLAGERHAYPLVAVYAQRFSGHRCALLGDAAVGMHPVTAHGYNLGLAGVERLTAALLQARRVGRDLGDADMLHRHYARPHHRHAWPLYEGTNAIVRLYTDDRPLPRLLRRMVLEGARRLAPVQSAIVGQLMGAEPARQAPEGAARGA
ncbi:5-demethoxyubiquinol-8 5-hydroxylase UbiM [Paracidovorax anthurii]|uniref:Ubiquinone biosynthesis UbiH/UbiF/VisC/COQ6 family hydroxylase n=2 Tax=Paracidovorax anthurii TaxID=78229 RepID=A0A328ZLV5_9BURK|nr:ubiquinone biosynthesis UbiH/UbiF/VisC/COQ6 family hydroxylase [Paracidovorax anthurii]